MQIPSPQTHDARGADSTGDRDDETSTHAPPPGPIEAFWYRIGADSPRVIRAADEDAARAAVRARHPESKGLRIAVEPYRL
jgi:hypothetical protein